MREARISIVNTRRRCIPDDASDIMARARERIASVGRDRPDLILLSELFANCPSGDNASEVAQEVPGPISEEMAGLARQHGCYIAFGLLRRDGDRIFNSLVLLDREGRHVWTYDKVTPLASEMDQQGITPGSAPSAYDCDFGRIGAAICFDVNFLELAEIWAKKEIDLLLFSSAFPAGRLLDYWALRYGFALAGSTWYDKNRVIDCTGATVSLTSDIMACTTAALNLNRRVVHMDGNLERLDRMRSRYSGDMLVEDMRDEAVCVITSLKKGLEVRDLIREFEIETLPDYFARSRRVREAHGGLPSSHVEG